ncbi:MAG: 50S ribosomal protein L24 [Actinobacteria bacterium]|nr:50S ribosomal protein L24 [Actinomycetota bacterium]
MRRSMSLRKGDTVQVLKGKDRGKKGKVLRVDSANGRILVEGINRTKKHMKPTQANPQGGVIDWELPINSSNVMLVCPGCEQPTRTRRSRMPGGKSFERICIKCNREF